MLLTYKRNKYLLYLRFLSFQSFNFNCKIHICPPHCQYLPPCNTENPTKWLFVTPYKSTFNQLVEEVVVTATLQCRTLSVCMSYTVLFGPSKPLNLHRKQGHYDVSKLFLIKLTFIFTMFKLCLTSKQQLTSSYLAPSSESGLNYHSDE